MINQTPLPWPAVLGHAGLTIEPTVVIDPPLDGSLMCEEIFGHDEDFVHDMLERSSSGGVNGSGMGRYKGVHGCRELSNGRSVFVQRK